MDIYSIGFTKTTAQNFFERLIDAGVVRVLDVRLNTGSQLAGFAKGRDLPYFLMRLGDIAYEHEPMLCPTQQILESFKRDKAMSWAQYEHEFLGLMDARHVADRLDAAAFQEPTALLCSEATAEHCHRRLVIDYLARHWPDVKAVHL